MADFRIDTSFFDNIKTMKLKRKIGNNGVLCLIKLWGYASENRSRGVLFDMDIDDIEICSGWDGDEGVFLAALLSVRFVDFTNNQYCLHNWETRNPWAFKTEERSKKASDAAKARWKKFKEGENTPSADAGVMPIAETKDKDSSASSNAPLLSSPSPSLPILSSPSPHEDKKPSSKRAKKAPLTGATWEAYMQAYKMRYNVEPTRNASVNGQLANFVKRVGAEDAPHVAGFFLRNNSQWYINKGHSVGSMLADAEKIHVEWKRGKAITNSQARQLDKTQNNMDAWSSVEVKE